MMLTVHGLPNKTKFQDVKDLIKQECNIPDFILDNLVEDGFNAKKVRIGLTNENDGYRLMKCLEGFRMSGSHILKVVPVGKPQSLPQPSFEPRSKYNQSRSDYSNQSQNYSNQHDYSHQTTVNPPNHLSPHSRHTESDSKHLRSHSESRGLSDAQQSLSQAMSDTRTHRDRYQGRTAPDMATSDRTEFRDPSRGPLAPPAIRPASLDSRVFETRGPQPGTLDPDAISMRGQDGSAGYQPMELKSVNPESVNQSPWSSGNEWSSQNSGYNYQEPQGNTGYGQQTNTVVQGGYPQSRGPVVQGYQQPKMPPSQTRTHVLRSVQLVDAPIAPRAAPTFPPSQKPVTIMKDNFQGPTQYNVTGTPQSAYQGQVPQSSWEQQGQTKELAYDKSYDDRRLALEKGAGIKPQSQDYDKRRFSSPRNRQNSPSGSPPRKAIATTRPGQTYPERRVSPIRPYTDRRVSPSRRITSTEFNSSGRRISPSKIAPAGRRVSPARKPSPVGRRVSPPGRRSSPGPRRISPFSRKISPPGRRVSPSRKASPIGRHISPSGKPNSPIRRTSPLATGRRISPFARKISPRRVSPGRRISPGRRVSPNRLVSSGRLVSLGSISPNGKRGSPGRRDARRMSPSMTYYDYYVEGERRMGGRQLSPRRYSPKRSPPRGSGRYSPSETKYETDLPGKASKPIRPAYEANQAQKYTGAGFRANETQYPASGRNEPKISMWQNEKITYSSKKDDHLNRMGRPVPVEKKISRSRSRSPVKDRYRRHSPSPRSPRRSWALEKRRSPEAIREPPPPPLWPGQDSEDKPKHPVWERNDYDEERRRREDKYTPRFSPRREVDDRREYRDEKKFERDYRAEDRANYRRDSPRRDDKKLFNEADKDFNDIYQRAVEFRRKTEELRKSNDRRNRSYDDEEDVSWRETPAVDRVEKPKPNWIPIKLQTKELERSKFRLEPAIKEKRDKAVDEIANRIIEPHTFTGEPRRRVMEELKLSIYNIMLEMFKDKDVSYIELVIKFRARYDKKDEEKILLDVLSSMPSHYKNNLLKRKGEGTTEVPPKIARRSPDHSTEESSRSKLSESVIPDWNMSIPPPKVLNLPMVNAISPIVNAAPGIVPQPVYVPSYPVPQQMYQTPLSTLQNMQAQHLQSQMQSNLQTQMQSTLQTQTHPNLQTHTQSSLQMQMRSNLQKQMQSQMKSMQQNIHSQILSNMQSMPLESTLQSDVEAIIHNQDDGYHLYLCQDDFEPFSKNQAEKLKDFLVSQMFKASETGDGWAPVFSLIGLHSLYRYELSTKDEASKNWIVNLDFSEFEFFNVLVYTKEELWYERAAIWLPGHSRFRNLEPLEKLRLQNQYVDGIKIGKWKFVKKIVTAKGTRLYVDMPPSSARALEKQKMMLSYELGKVNVYLKAVAVDKEAFDAGLKVHSITEPSELAAAAQSIVMPTLPRQQVDIVKVTLNGAKSITIQQAGKIKEMIVYNLFKYHQQEGRCKTDFLKYGFCPPNCIGIEPENNESRRWLINRSFGKLNRQNIIVLDGEDANTKYFRMRATVPMPKFSLAMHNTQLTMEKLRTSNRGMKGLNFSFWKPISLTASTGGKGIFEVDVDLQSTETLIKNRFQLDYVDEHGTKTIHFKSDYSLSKLEEKIWKHKAEQVDVYDVANMELDSDSE